MSQIAQAFRPSMDELSALSKNVGQLAIKSLEHNEAILFHYLSQIAPPQNFNSDGSKKVILDKSQIDPRTRQPIPQITLMRVEDVRKMGMLYSILLMDLKIKFNGAAAELGRVHSCMTAEQFKEIYPGMSDEEIKGCIEAAARMKEEMKKAEAQASADDKAMKQEQAQGETANG